MSPQPLLLGLVVGVVALAMPAAGAEPGRVTRTPLVLVGGGSVDAPLLAEAASLAGGTRARVLVVALSSSHPDVAGPAYETMFRNMGLTADYLPLPDRAAATAPDVARRVAAADLVFFTGGDQARLLDGLAGTPSQGALIDAWRRGMVVSGTSAGAMPWGPMAIAGGSSIGALSRGSDSDPRGEKGIDVRPGLGLFDRWLVDTHFTQMERLGRLAFGVAARPAMLGLGIDQDTAAILEGDHLRVLGAGAVTVVDGRSLKGNNQSLVNARTPLAVGPFVIQRLVGGQAVDLPGADAAPALPAAGSRAGTTGNHRPVTLLGASAPPGSLDALNGFGRDAGGTEARILVLAGNGALRDADLWRSALLLAGVGRTSLLSAADIHDRSFATSLESASGIFLLEDAVGSLLETLQANRGQLRDVLNLYAQRVPFAAAGYGVRIIGRETVLGSPIVNGGQLLPGLALLNGLVADDAFWGPEGGERLARAILAAGSVTGVGLGPEDAVRIEGDQCYVMGKGQAILMEGSAARATVPPEQGSTKPVAYTGMALSIVPPGGTYDLLARTPRF